MSDRKDKEIEDLKGQVSFHKSESQRWRELFNEQRGGEVFNDLQKRYADSNVQISRLNLALKKAREKAVVYTDAHKSSIDRPKFCPDDRCNCLAQVKTDKSDWEFGASFECLGELPAVEIYTAGKTEHDNNISHCIWSVRGWTRWYINKDDLGLMVMAYIEAFIANGGNARWMRFMAERGFSKEQIEEDTTTCRSCEECKLDKDKEPESCRKGHKLGRKNCKDYSIWP